MTAGGGGEDLPAAGGPARHIPVLRDEVVAALAPRDGDKIVDGTFGAGGYARAVLAAADAHVFALDRDPAAVAAGAALVASSEGRLRLVEARFSQIEAVATAAGFVPLDGLTLDVGVSSMQLDDGARGFSFRHDGPLDMRMGSHGQTAADLVNGLEETALANLIYGFGEERASRRIARAVVHDRETRPFTSTRQLAEMIARIMPARPTDIHPATRTFQALRIAVNDELGELEAALHAAERLLRPGGRLAVVTFHSLEDRTVKRFLGARSGKGAVPSRRLPHEPPARLPTFTVARGQPIVPSAAECAANPRARSAKLRFAARTDAPIPPAMPER